MRSRVMPAPSASPANGADASVSVGGNVTAIGDGASGVYAVSTHGPVNVNVYGDVLVEGEAGDAYGVAASTRRAAPQSTCTGT